MQNIINKLIELNISINRLQQAIKSSDFLISDEYSIHRLVDLRYDSKTMHEPEITIICTRYEMAGIYFAIFLIGVSVHIIDSNQLTVFCIISYIICKTIERENANKRIGYRQVSYFIH